VTLRTLPAGTALTPADGMARFDNRPHIQPRPGCRLLSEDDNSRCNDGVETKAWASGTGRAAGDQMPAITQGHDVVVTKSLPKGCRRQPQRPRSASAPGVRLALVLMALMVGLMSRVPVATADDNVPAYKSLRYDEDYTYLQDASRRTDIWDSLKYIRLLQSPQIYLSFGGELRERFEDYSAPSFGLGGQGADDYLLHRLLLHADLHLGQYVRTFVQFGSELQSGKDTLTLTDVDRLDLQQGFIDLQLPIAADSGIAPIIRAGRQEMQFGSQRFVSAREPPNIRRSFDGFRVNDTLGKLQISAFAMRPVLLKQGEFDDETNQDQAFWGTYETFPVSAVPGLNLDVYYLGFENQQAKYGGRLGEETRHTLGLRAFGKADGWDWDSEAAGQFGSFGNQNIRAWTVASNTGYSLSGLPWSPRLGVKANIASGDGDPQDGHLGTFNALFPRLGYFSEAALIAPSNFFDVQPSITLQPCKNLSINIGWDALWRETTADAIYIGAGSPVKGTAGKGGRYIGNQVSLDVDWQIDRHLEAKATYVHFESGQALHTAGGKNVDFVMLSTAYKF
jgi:hypothetical protein